MPSNSTTTVLGTSWNFSNLWNKALDSMPERALVRRSHIWASELGSAYIDRYLKMNAVAYTNPPNARSRRKFIAGHIWEWIINLVLTMCGVLKSSQVRTEVEIKGLLKVTGRMDFIAGGQVDWEKAKADIKKIQSLFAISIDEMPPFIFYAIEYIIADLERTFKKKHLKEVIFECKAISSFMSAKVERVGAMPHHILQIGHYLIGGKRDEGYLSYICKDDCISNQFNVVNNAALIKSYKADVKQMTDYYGAGFNERKPLQFAPPKEQEIKFSEGVWRFEKNFYCEYSNYLTMLYGYETPEMFRDRWAKPIASYNRTFKRCVRGDNMTALNKDVIKEVSKIFPEWDKYVLLARKNGAFQKQEDDNDE